ncbi:MAG: fluoride efflux transporter CrcB [Nevskiaceae bacterium]|jgi:CrcB protein|nr:fluoride efflux transporter CrcB [Nevskiaceae bacterium]
MVIKNILLVFVGAGTGGVARYLVNTAFNPLLAPFPLSTLTVNVAGGFLAGILVALLALRPGLDPTVRLLLLTGFMGGLTTFSAFSTEVGLLLQAGRALQAATAIALHVVGSVGAALLGMALCRALLTR